MKFMQTKTCILYAQEDNLNYSGNCETTVENFRRNAFVDENSNYGPAAASRRTNRVLYNIMKLGTPFCAIKCII